jgi:hypothetical protein
VASATDSGEASGAGNRRCAVSCYADGTSSNDVAWDYVGYEDIVTALRTQAAYRFYDDGTET